MTIADACILVSCVLPVLCAGLAKWPGMGRPRRDGGFDNHNPRQWLAKLQGWQARANAAQQNSFEALPFFIAAVLVAQQLQAPQGRIDNVALLFVAARIAYIGSYLADAATVRSASWVIGAGACIALFFLA